MTTTSSTAFIDWRQDAACRDWADRLGHDTIDALFYPGKGATQRPAKKICATCPVNDACLDDALATEPSDAARYGIRGGLSPDERRTVAHLQQVSA